MAKPRKVHIECKTPKGFRWIKTNLRGGKFEADGSITVTDQTKFDQCMDAAECHIIEGTSAALAKRSSRQPLDACSIMNQIGAGRDTDFHTLNSSAVSKLIDAADAVGYRKSKNANGSRGRSFFAYLQRKCFAAGTKASTLVEHKGSLYRTAITASPVLPAGVLNLVTGKNSILGDVKEWRPKGSITIVRRPDGGIRGVINAGMSMNEVGSKLPLVHDQTRRNIGETTVIGVFPLTAEGLQAAQKAAGKTSVGIYVYK